MTTSPAPYVVATSPQQRRAVTLGRVAALAPALESGWTLLRLAMVADAATFRTALHAVRRDEIFSVELVTPVGARTPFQRQGDGRRTEIRIDDRVGEGANCGVAWARQVATKQTVGITLAAAPAGPDGWWLLVRGGATHMDLGSAFEVARRVIREIAAGPVDTEVGDDPSYLDAADALDEVAGSRGDTPPISSGRRVAAPGGAPRTTRTLSLGIPIAQAFDRLGRQLGVGWDAAALAAWTRVILMRGDRSGACALGVDGRIGDLAPVIGPLAWSEAFTPSEPGAIALRGIAALAEGAIRHARDGVVPAAIDSDAPLVWTHGFETLDLRRSPSGVAMIDSTIVIEPALVTLRAVSGPDWHDLTLVYDAARIDDDAVAILSARLAALATTTAFDLPLRHLPATVAADRMLADAADGCASRGPSTCESVGERLVALATAHPEATALATLDGDVSYASLLDQARQVAAVLAGRGIGRGGSVGVSLDRGVSLYVTLCGILLSGAYYVPIDPETPPERLEQLAKGSDIDLLVATSAIAAMARAWGLRAIADDAWTHAVASASPATVLPPRSPPLSSPAYMIYTSGTTGGPKGVVISHGALINYADAVAGRLGAKVGTRLAALSTYAADLSYTAVWGGLLSGGCVCCLPADATLDASKLADAMQQFRIDWLKIVPAHWQALAANADAAVLDRLLPRAGLVFGGDVLSTTVVAALRAVRPGLRIVNHYGPTETTVGALAHDVETDATDDDAAEAVVLPIGRPLANMRAVVADPRGREIDLGNEGMLLIGGPGVANGYRRAPGLTADRFRPARYGPFGGRIYRTGDRARRLPGGAIAFLGRADDQLKIRGFRVEPQEVATTIRAVSDARDVAVVADAGGQALLAFVVPHPLGIDIDALRGRLSALLPAHAVPREIHVVRRLPLSRNGKVDRIALLDMAKALQDRRVVAPRTPFESTIADIWREALGTRSVGVDENFFTLGGHSLLATQILARIRQRLSVDVSIADFFAYPTVEGLAARAHAAPRGQAALEARAASAPALLSLGQERLWFLTRTGDNPAAYNNAYAVSVRGPFDADRFGRAVSVVVARQIALRMGVVENEGIASAIVVAPPVIRPDVHDLTALSPAARDEAVTRRLAIAASAPFDLSAPPLLRVQVLRTEADRAVIGLVVHHIVWDGWSNAVFTREVFDAYSRDDGNLSTPPLELDYFDHIAAERRWAQSPTADEHLGYWTGRLASIPPLDLGSAPDEGPVGPGELGFTIDRSVVDALQERAAAQGATEFMALLAAYFVALWREGGQTSFAVGTSVSNRTGAATESMIGYFVNQVALCADLKGNPTMADLLDRVRNDAVAAFAASTIPFGTIVHRLRLEREAGRSPVFQTMLVRQAGAAAAIAVGDLVVEPVIEGEVQARFDVTLYIGDGPDGLLGTFVYDTAVLEPAAVARLRDGFLDAARLIATEPATHLSQFGHRGAALSTATPPADRRRFVPGSRRAVATAGTDGNKG